MSSFYLISLCLNFPDKSKRIRWYFALFCFQSITDKFLIEMNNKNMHILFILAICSRLLLIDRYLICVNFHFEQSFSSVFFFSFVQTQNSLDFIWGVICKSSLLICVCVYVKFIDCNCVKFNFRFGHYLIEIDQSKP